MAISRYTDGPPAVETALVADIPVLFARPETTKAGGRLALWMHFLGGSKEAMVPFLLRLAEAGVTAVSFDAWQHGQRTNEPLDQLMTRAFGQFRRNVWPILGHHAGRDARAGLGGRQKL